MPNMLHSAAITTGPIGICALSKYAFIAGVSLLNSVYRLILAVNTKQLWCILKSFADAAGFCRKLIMHQKNSQ